MIDFPAVFRALLMGSAALFLGALLLFGLREASRQRADMIARMEEAARRPPLTHLPPMQGGWGCPAPAEDTEANETITSFAPADRWIP